MPELPDVADFCRRISEVALHHRIIGVELGAPEMVKGVTAPHLRHRVEGRTIDAARRYGKHLLLGLDGSGWLDLHFGMSGHPELVAPGAPLPAYTRLALRLDNATLAYVVPRKLGQIGWVESPEQLVSEKHLGIDALDPALDFNHFRRLAHGKGAVKCWLMDQSQLAGIGNVYSDEILYHARLHPTRRAGELSEPELRRLYRQMHAVLESSLAHGADPARLPRTWLLPHRRAGEACPACTGRIQRLALCGRSAYLCPACQH